MLKLHITCKRCDFSIMRSYFIFWICAIINTPPPLIFVNMAAYNTASDAV